MIEKIVSGGQTGADRGGLNAAIELGIAHGGWCPRGRRAEDGVVPQRYSLVEMNSRSYLLRTEKNVVDSDVTMVFTLGRLTPGSKRTMEFAEKHDKPCKHFRVGQRSGEDAASFIVKWLCCDLPYDLEHLVVNVAGSRESKAKGIQQRVKQVLVEAVEMMAILRIA